MEQVNIEKVNELIKQKGVSQYELAERCGVSQSTISKHLKTGNFGVNELLGIADALEVSIKDLFKKANKFRAHIIIDSKEYDNKEEAATFAANIAKVFGGSGHMVERSVRKVCANEQERLF